MLTVGFEPTRANTEHLKCSPLDQLGHVSDVSDSNILGTRQFSIGTNPRFRVLQQGSNLHPVINSDWVFCCKFLHYSRAGARTQDLRLIRPMLYRLSYTRLAILVHIIIFISIFR